MLKSPQGELSEEAFKTFTASFFRVMMVVILHNMHLG